MSNTRRKEPICPDCKTTNSFSASYCERCSAPLLNQEVESYPTTPLPTQEDVPLAVVDTSTILSRQFVGLAAVLSTLLPGLGQIYAGALGKGIIILLLWIIAMPMFSALPLFFGLGPRVTFLHYLLIWPALIIAWAVNILDAASTADQ